MSTRKTISAVGFAIALLVAASATPTRAAIINLQAVLDGLQEVPPVATLGSGTGMFTLDTGTGDFNYNISFAGLLAPETASHIHKAQAGVNGGVVFSLPLGSPKVGLIVLSPAQQADLLAGLYYVNVHSSFRPGGEIRGQISEVPEPASAGLAAIGGLCIAALALIRRVTHRGA